jgi:acyl carrier protein
MEQLFAILESIKPSVDYENETALVDDKIIDSFDLISLIGELNDKFGVSIGVENLTPENFNSAHAIYELIQKLKAL